MYRQHNGQPSRLRRRGRRARAAAPACGPTRWKMMVRGAVGAILCCAAALGQSPEPADQPRESDEELGKRLIRKAVSDADET